MQHQHFQLDEQLIDCTSILVAYVKFLFVCCPRIRIPDLLLFGENATTQFSSCPKFPASR